MPSKWKALRDYASADTGRPDEFVKGLLTQFITQPNPASHCADFEHYKVLNYTYSLSSIF